MQLKNKDARHRTWLRRIYNHLFCDRIIYDLGVYKRLVHDIREYGTTYKLKTDKRLKEKALLLRKKVESNKSDRLLLVEMFALVNEAIRRILHIEPFDEQLIAGIVMYNGKLVQMQTGEGKTLAAVFPATMHALTGKGVHVLTFNDYLAKRDAQWMGPVYKFFEFSVNFVQEDMGFVERKKAYNSDITYLTAKEAGFDFLRDNLCYNQEDIVQREFNCAIIDEADSILIDEARVPLVIAGYADGYNQARYNMAQLVKRLSESIDFEYEPYVRNIYITEKGLRRIEQLLNCRNLHDGENDEILAQLNCALYAEYLLQKDKDYIVRDGKIELVDEFTGRVADKRRMPDGLQEAIEAKEQLRIQPRGRILNSITLQHFIELYPTMSGMTATAEIAGKEFKEFYKLQIVVIPPHKPCIRVNQEDKIYRTKKAKQKAVLQEIVRVHETKRPILVGTGSVKESEELAHILQKMGVVCQVLNAKRDAYEAEIIAMAGTIKTVTISTNMAGRGIDIRLGCSDEQEQKQVKALGGLYVIGTNRHESKRIDEQLRGRAGRQGDPGLSRFFISLEDDIFVACQLEKFLPRQIIVNKDEEIINNPIIKKLVNRLQKNIESQNLEMKKTLYKYSHLVEQQRKIIFHKRKTLLLSDSAIKMYKLHFPEQYIMLSKQIGTERLGTICRKHALFYLDKAWSEYLGEISLIRESIHLLRFGGQVPIFEFYRQSINIFASLQDKAEYNIIQSFRNISIEKNGLDLPKAPSATWTYLVTDDSFGDILGMQLMGNMGMNVWAGFLWPLLLLYPLLKKLKGKI